LEASNLSEWVLVAALNLFAFEELAEEALGIRKSRRRMATGN